MEECPNLVQEAAGAPRAAFSLGLRRIPRVRQESLMRVALRNVVLWKGLGVPVVAT
jgi:hypothetical protein